jgi:hypothetical protein
LIRKEDKGNKLFFNSRAIVNACRPYHWKDEFPRKVGASEEMKRAVLQKWRRPFSVSTDTWGGYGLKSPWRGYPLSYRLQKRS